MNKLNLDSMKSLLLKFVEGRHQLLRVHKETPEYLNSDNFEKLSVLV